MTSGTVLDDLEAALEHAIERLDDGSPAGAQIRYHFGFDDGTPRRGKRLRSLLALEVTEEEGASRAAGLDAAVAIEIIHEFSLIHDDIQDNDRLRRGREAVWSRYGLAHGINAGDSLCAVAYLALLEGGAPLGAERKLRMTRALLDAHLAMCAGQARDIAFETAEHRVTMDEYRAMIGGKTAALFGAACELGALAAGASDERARAYARLGRAYGTAFQIEDDALGIWGDSAATGKPSGADLAKRKWTFPVVWALEGPPSRARETVATAYARGAALDGTTVDAIVAALDELGARAASDDAARVELDDAQTAADASGIDRSGRVRAFLRQALRRLA